MKTRSSQWPNLKPTSGKWATRSKPWLAWRRMLASLAASMPATRACRPWPRAASIRGGIRRPPIPRPRLSARISTRLFDGEAVAVPGAKGPVAGESKDLEAFRSDEDGKAALALAGVPFGLGHLAARRLVIGGGRIEHDLVVDREKGAQVGLEGQPTSIMTISSPSGGKNGSQPSTGRWGGAT